MSINDHEDRICTECSGRSCGPIGIAHCSEQLAEDERRREEERERMRKLRECQHCECADAVFVLATTDALTGQALDSLLLCAECAQEEAWYLDKDGKVGC